MTVSFRGFPKFTRWILAFVATFLLCIAQPTWAASTAQQDVQKIDSYIEQAIAQSETKDLATAGASYQQFRKGWSEIEDGVRDTSRPAYREIETAMGQVRVALKSEPADPAQVATALKHLHEVNQQFVRGEIAAEPTPTAANQKVTIASLIERLDRADAALNRDDVKTAATEIKGFQTDWVEVEGVVSAKSHDAYVEIENTMATAYALLQSQPAKMTQAHQAIATLRTDLQPFATGTVRYTLFDSAVILLREGMEALLVLVALCAFLVKSDNGDKSRWIWIGAGVGILASIATALIIHLVFSNIPVGENRELLEGMTGLVAAVLLFYVSYWLHSKASMGVWQTYIKEKTTAALATNSVFSLSLLAFLSVFREGAETVLFYIGIAPSISTSDLLGGLAVGSVILAIAAALMLGLGLRIPLKPFFLVTSLLIYYLGFKFVGAGLHALQVSHILPAHSANFLPALSSLGLYPTWETTLAQLTIILVAVGIVLYERSQSPGVATTGNRPQDS